MSVSPIGRVPFYARNPLTDEIYLVGGVNSLDDLNDVDLDIGSTGPSGPTDGSVLLWSEAEQRWIPGIASTVGVISDLLDVDTESTPPEDSAALVWDGSASQWVPGSPAVEVPEEVVVSDVAPTGPATDLWYDVTDTTVASPDEVVVASEDPRVTNPAAQTELWFDTTTDPGTLKAWVGGAWVEASATGDFLPLGGGMMASNAIIRFPNEASPTTKLMLYGDPAANGFGFGIESGTMTAFQSSTFRWRANSMTGAIWAEITASGLGPSRTSNVTWESGWSGTATCRYTPAVCTIRLTNVSRTSNCDTGAQVKMFNYPSGFPAPPDVSTGYRTVAFERNDNFSRDNPARMITLHFDGTAAYVIATGDIFYSGKKFDAVITWAR